MPEPEKVSGALARHPDAPRFHQRREGSGAQLLSRSTRDPSLRLKSGFAPDGATLGKGAEQGL
jgi:hypothetical protein